MSDEPDPRARALLPRPRTLTLGREALTLGAPLRAGAAAERTVLPGALTLLARAFERRGLDGDGRGAVPLAFEHDAALPPEGYRLSIEPRGVTIAAADERGHLWGAATLAQLVLEAPATSEGLALARGVVEDAPELARRGVMLDVSRDRVPTMETLERLVVLFAGWKLNELQLYTEHTFAFAGHEEVWRDSGALTPDEVRHLDRSCRRFGIELVPNQQCFGHLHRWLALPRYRPLAECPEGVEHPFNDAIEPFSLCPEDPAALALVEDLLDQLLPCFSSGELHVGLDETFDLGLGRSRAACAERGVGRVHTDFLRRLDDRVRARGRRTWYWADVALRHPEALDLLPRDAVACSWGYEAGHAFDDELGRLAALGIPSVACPGTTSWKSFVGRPANMAANVAEAADAARRHGALGLLVTDWGDQGHLQPLPVSYPGWAAAAARAWRVDPAPPTLDELAPAVDRDAFEGLHGATRVLWELGRAGERVGYVPNATVPFQALLRPATFPPPCEPPLAREPLERALREARALLARLPVPRPPQDPRASGDALHRDELAWAGQALALGCRLALARLAQPAAPLAALPRAERAALAAELAAAIEGHRRLWPARSRPGGAADSRRRLESLAALLGPA